MKKREKYSLAKSLLDELELFEQQQPDAGLAEFAQWLGARTAGGAQVRGVLQFDENHDYKGRQSPEVEIGKLLPNLYRYARHYTKKVLADTPLHSIEEFGFLASLITDKTYSKSELTQMQLMEFTSGISALNRLLEKGIVQETSDPEDKRKRRIGITEKGKQLMFRIFGSMNQVALLVSGPLDESEKLAFVQTMEKLAAFHRGIHEQDKDSPLELLFTKYLQRGA